jgi:hypothetical protein
MANSRPIKKKSQLLTFPFLFSPEMFVLGSRKEEERANK